MSETILEAKERFDEDELLDTRIRPSPSSPTARARSLVGLISALLRKEASWRLRVS